MGNNQCIRVEEDHEAIRKHTVKALLQQAACIIAAVVPLNLRQSCSFQLSACSKLANAERKRQANFHMLMAGSR